MPAADAFCMERSCLPNERAGGDCNRWHEREREKHECQARREGARLCVRGHRRDVSDAGVVLPEAGDRCSRRQKSDGGFEEVENGIEMRRWVRAHACGWILS